MLLNDSTRDEQGRFPNRTSNATIKTTNNATKHLESNTITEFGAFGPRDIEPHT